MDFKQFPIVDGQTTILSNFIFERGCDGMSKWKFRKVCRVGSIYCVAEVQAQDIGKDKLATANQSFGE